MSTENLPAKGKKRHFLFRFSEDSWAVYIASILIMGVLLVAMLNKDISFPKPAFAWDSTESLLHKVLTVSNVLLLTMIGICFALVSSVALFFMGVSPGKYIPGFILIYFIGIVSLIIAGNRTINYYGVEYVVFALIIGLVISNLAGRPAWLGAAARSEFFIKTGLVILGTSILFPNIVEAGLPGILQGIIVVLVVWFFAMWLCRRLKVDDEFAVILASAVSICGVSAAIVASGAIRGDRRKLSYVTTLVLLVAVPMMILQPWIIRVFHIPEIVGGAWLGGTLDTTASVTAAAELVGPQAMKTGIIVKFSQNVLIGFAAFFIAAWWVYRKKSTGQEANEKTRGKLIWERFPKFVLGFIAASLIFSFLIPEGTTKLVSGFLNTLRTLWFAMAFVAIGLEARFSDLVKMQGGRPALAFIGAQVFNIIFTLLIAYLLFGGVLFPVPTIK